MKMVLQILQSKLNLNLCMISCWLIILMPKKSLMTQINLVICFLGLELVILILMGILTFWSLSNIKMAVRYLIFFSIKRFQHKKFQEVVLQWMKFRGLICQRRNKDTETVKIDISIQTWLKLNIMRFYISIKIQDTLFLRIL